MQVPVSPSPYALKVPPVSYVHRGDHTYVFHVEEGLYLLMLGAGVRSG